MRLEGLVKLKYLMTLTGIETAIFRLVEQYLNQLRYRLPASKHVVGNKTSSMLNRFFAWYNKIFAFLKILMKNGQYEISGPQLTN
jgi:hypothetical protein